MHGRVGAMRHHDVDQGIGALFEREAFSSEIEKPVGNHQAEDPVELGPFGIHEVKTNAVKTQIVDDAAGNRLEHVAQAGTFENRRGHFRGRL
jgi:hypothetical protein